MASGGILCGLPPEASAFVYLPILQNPLLPATQRLSKDGDHRTGGGKEPKH